MAFETHIPDISHYTQEMRKSMIDKIYFMDKVDADVFVDFGCADGTLIEYLRSVFPEKTYIGYDISEEMISKAEKNNGHAYFTSDWDEVKNILKNEGKSCLVLSSIIHEIYSYLSEKEIAEFWNKVWNTGFNYVAIRDMMASSSTSRPSDPISVARVKQLQDRNKIADWEQQWGSLNENWSLLHFLLTYRYEKNWKRELKENYMPINLEEFLNQIPKEYMPDYIEHYTLPFIRQQVEKDFGIQLQDRTHLKLILRYKGPGS